MTLHADLFQEGLAVSLSLFQLSYDIQLPTSGPNTPSPPPPQTTATTIIYIWTFIIKTTTTRLWQCRSTFQKTTTTHSPTQWPWPLFWPWWWGWRDARWPPGGSGYPSAPPRHGSIWPWVWGCRWRGSSAPRSPLSQMYTPHGTGEARWSWEELQTPWSLEWGLIWPSEWGLILWPPEWGLP